MTVAHLAKLPFVFKTGIGLDIHSFDKSSISKDNYIILCGIKIPYIYKISAHSDGDVALHALTDALLGSVAGGSIGVAFPPSDLQWKDADSSIFVMHAHSIVLKQSGIISNIDMIVICEAPPIMQHATMMRQNLANILALSIEQVNIKAVTAEKLGALGRRDGIAVQVICTIMLPYP